MAFGIFGCAKLPVNVDRPVSHAMTDTASTRLASRVSDLAAAHPNESGFHLLQNGLNAFVARMVLAKAAEHSIDLQYYLYHKDLTGKMLTHALLEAADRGVRVRILVDDMGLEGREVGAATLDLHPNIEVRIVNPFGRNVSRIWQFVTGLGTLTRRMHNKSFTADNQITILGGRNIGNEYFEADPDLMFHDLDVMAIGPIVGKTSKVFDLYWNSALAYPASALVRKRPSAQDIASGRKTLAEFVAAQSSSPYHSALKNSQLLNAINDKNVKFDWGTARIVFDHPDKLSESRERTDLHLSSQIAPFFDDLRRELIIFSPYFVPGKDGVTNLTTLVKKGVRVRILTNSLASNDVSVVHAGYAKYRRALLRGGVEIYEMNKRLTENERREKRGLEGSSKASLHAKSFVLDRERVFIGSLNLDPRSIVENTEIGVVFESAEVAKELTDKFETMIEKLTFRLELKKDKEGYEQILWHSIEDGKPRVFTADPYTSPFRRVLIRMIGWLPIESQL